MSMWKCRRERFLTYHDLSLEVTKCLFALFQLGMGAFFSESPTAVHSDAE